MGDEQDEKIATDYFLSFESAYGTKSSIDKDCSESFDKEEGICNQEEFPEILEQKEAIRIEGFEILEPANESKSLIGCQTGTDSSSIKDSSLIQMFNELG